METYSKAPSNSMLADLAHKYPNSVGYVPHFIFNNYLLKDFDHLSYAPFKVPCIFGYLYIKSLMADASKKFDFALISKKDCRRPGRRFIVRGIDKEGNVANFVETEHVITLYEQGDAMRVATYVQTRGSIPALWSQKPTMKWSPTVRIHQNTDESLNLALKHVSEIKSSYREQVFINLIDKKGSQLRIGTTFTHIMDRLKDNLIKYVWFDFHHECRKMRWENLSKLVD
jgi:phosphatidylinositol 4-phosphatase